MRKRKKILSVLTLICTIMMMLFAFSGCSQSSQRSKGIDGTWRKTKIIESDGNVLEGEDIGPDEYYKFEGNKAWYAGSIDSLNKKVDISYELREHEDGTYSLHFVKDGTAKEKPWFEGITVNGDTMNLPVLDDTFVFTRQ